MTDKDDKPIIVVGGAMRGRGLMALAAAMAMAGPALAVQPTFNIGRRDPLPDLGWAPRRERRKGRSRTMRGQRTSLEAYKAQRRANRLRRKALNK